MAKPFRYIALMGMLVILSGIVLVGCTPAPEPMPANMPQQASTPPSNSSSSGAPKPP